MTDQVDVLVFGLGAIGSFYAFILHRADRVRLTVVARSNHDAVKENGILIKSQNHGEHRFHPYRVIKTPSEAKATQFDYVVCAHKALDPDGAAASLAPVIGETTTIVILQNGVGNEEPFRLRYPSSTIISAAIWVGASQPTPGVIHHTGAENTVLGLFPTRQTGTSSGNSVSFSEEDETRLQTFTSLLRSGRHPCSTSDNIQLERWEKVVWNVAWNATTALTMQDTQAWLSSSEDAVGWTRRLMGEVIAVARACGVGLRQGLVEELLERVRGLGRVRTSMQMDRECGRAMEVEVILGVPVRKGRERGVDVPCLETLYVLLRALDRQVQGRS